jgi:serine/threonine protein kinase
VYGECPSSYKCRGSEKLLTRYLDSYQGYGKAVDWWAAGVLLYEMLHGIPPCPSGAVKRP